ncbi:MAG: RNA polymerase sigma factor [Pyrinomonadaceae bacterium]
MTRRRFGMHDACEGMNTATSDEQIVARALTGDADAFGEIVRRWERRIYALAYGMLGREDEARDATQDTFVAAFRNLRGFRGESKVSSWLHRIAVNQCITRQRRAKVRGESSLDEQLETAGDGAFFASAVDSPGRVTEARERSEAVRRAVAALPTELRQIIVMKEFEELTFQQIADALDIPLSTVKSRLYTALKQLRLRLAKHGNAAEVASR